MTNQFTRSNTRASKLTGEVVLEIRRLYHQEKWTQGRLAREFQVSIGQIGRIVRGECWQHLQMPASNLPGLENPGGVLPLTAEVLDRQALESQERLRARLEGLTGLTSEADGVSPSSESAGLNRLSEEARRLEAAEHRAGVRAEEYLGVLAGGGGDAD